MLKINNERKALLYCRDLDINEIISLLGSSNSYIRNAAIIRLQLEIYTDHKLVINMIQLCSSGNYRLRTSGVSVLGCFENLSAESLEIIINILSCFALHDSSREVRISAIYSFGYRYSIDRRYHPFIISILKKTANDDNNLIRLATVHALQNVRDKSAIPIAEKLLRDDNKDVRNWAAFSLQLTGLDSDEIRNGLVAMLKDECDEARYEAIYALTTFRDRRVLPALQQELQKETIILKMLEAAGDLGDAELLPYLKNIVNDFKGSADEGERIAIKQFRRLQRKVQRQMKQ